MSLPRLIVDSVEDYQKRSNDGKYDLYKVVFKNPITDDKYILYQRRGDKGLGSVNFIPGDHYHSLALYQAPNVKTQIDSDSPIKRCNIVDFQCYGIVGNVYIYYSVNHRKTLYIYKLNSGVRVKYQVGIQSHDDNGPLRVKVFDNTYTKQDIFNNYGIYDFE